jgi:hypothetical protein
MEDPGQTVAVTRTVEQQAVFDDIERERQASAAMSAQDLLDKYPAAFASSLPYNPLLAENLDLIESRFGVLPSPSRDLLANHGFVIRSGHPTSTFGRGYYSIYEADLPVFVSADAILEAVYRSHQSILMGIEQAVLLPALESMLHEMRRALQQGACSGFSASTCADVDEYLAVALSLAQDSLAKPVQGGDASLVQSLVDAAGAAASVRTFVLFGSQRSEDMSQFKPRGHYTKSTTTLSVLQSNDVARTHRFSADRNTRQRRTSV